MKYIIERTSQFKKDFKKDILILSLVRLGSHSRLFR